MIRTVTALLGLAFLTPSALRAQDNPLLREALSVAIKRELSKHHSEETAWTSDKKEQLSFNVGPIHGSIQTHIKTWVWLDDPAQNLKVDVSRFELKGDRLTFAVSAKGKLSGKAWARAKPIAEGDTKASADATILVEGTARLAEGRFTDVDVTRCQAQLSNLNFNNDVLKALRGPIQDRVNESFREKEPEMKRQLKETIEQFRP